MYVRCLAAVGSLWMLATTSYCGCVVPQRKALRPRMRAPHAEATDGIMPQDQEVSSVPLRDEEVSPLQICKYSNLTRSKVKSSGGEKGEGMGCAWAAFSSYHWAEICS